MQFKETGRRNPSCFPFRQVPAHTPWLHGLPEPFAYKAAGLLPCGLFPLIDILPERKSSPFYTIPFLPLYHPLISLLYRLDIPPLFRIRPRHGLDFPVQNYCPSMPSSTVLGLIR